MGPRIGITPRSSNVGEVEIVNEEPGHAPVEKGKLLARARRMEGQASGVVRMLQEERSCPEILQQIVALTSAAEELSVLLIRDHIIARWESPDLEAHALADELSTLLRRVLRH